MRTGTSTCTSRNGRIRIRRMYWSRPMRLAARSNWLSTIDLPDIVVRAGALPERPVAVTGEDLRGKSVRRQAAAGQTARRVLGLGRGMRHVGAARASPAAVREHADHVRAVAWEGGGGGGGGGRGGRLRGHLGGVREDEHQPARVFRDGRSEGGPAGVRGLRALG